MELPDEIDVFTDADKYLEGTQNWIIRAYFYCSNGLTILNEFRNMFLGIIAVYFALKLTNYWYLLAMIVPCLIILTLVGWVVVHRISKVREWLGIRFGTFYGLKSFNYQKESYNLLKEIRDSLKK